MAEPVRIAGGDASLLSQRGRDAVQAITLQRRVCITIEEKGSGRPEVLTVTELVATDRPSRAGTDPELARLIPLAPFNMEAPGRHIEVRDLDSSELGRVPKTEEIEQVFLLTRVMYKAVLGVHFKRKVQKQAGQLPIF